MLCRLSVYPEATEEGDVLRAALKNYKHGVEIKVSVKSTYPSVWKSPHVGVTLY
jgi:hypothetical protein